MQELKLVNQKLLRCGYTTGSCAAAAAKAAAHMLLSGTIITSVSLKTPNGSVLNLDVLESRLNESGASCAIKKDSGDDPDITNGILVYAQVEKTNKGISINGGNGVGRVTLPGLDQPVGEAAINSTPRRMITEALMSVCSLFNYPAGLSVTISIPGGEALARRTFNPRMGIEGGLSIIGTTGIVEPMSNRAIVDTIRLELSQLAASGESSVLLTPGNYGETFLRQRLMLSTVRPMLCSNFIGDTIDAAVEMGFSRILLVGHIGKLVKLGIGITNTHSAFGDGRMEALAACALEAGADLSLLKSILACVTTDAALELLINADILDSTMDMLGRRVNSCLDRRIPDNVEAGYVIFTNLANKGILCQSANAQSLINIWRDR